MRRPTRLRPSALYCGDNLAVLRQFIDDESIDLVYLDPPFNSGRDYNLLFEPEEGTPRPASQIKMFEDTWQWDEGSRDTYEEVLASGAKVGKVLESIRGAFGATPMLAYLSMMAIRLVELHRVLKSTGSIYLHCDCTASAYLRMLMDAIFGTKNFRNEIYWYYYNKIHDRRKRLFPRATDTLLFYVKNVDAPFTFHQLTEKREVPTKQLVRKKVEGKMVNAKDAAGHVMYHIKEDRTLDNVWRIPSIQPADKKQRTGYPTQKPEALLERVINASSNEGDLVLDPFCGCGTTIAVAQRSHRRWIGIDIMPKAIKITERVRLVEPFGAAVKQTYRTLCVPCHKRVTRALRRRLAGKAP